MNASSNNMTCKTNQRKIRNIADVLISITAPAYNEEDNLELLCERLISSLEKVSNNFEIIIVDNGSSDNSVDILYRLANKDPRIKYVLLSRNFGHQGGLVAGMYHCSGDLVVTMDADLQHPPEVVPELLRQWENGYDVVGTVKSTHEHTSLLRKILNKIFYKYVGASIGIPLSQYQSDFRLLDKSALKALLSLPEKEKFLRGLTYWIGFKQTSVSFEPATRFHGKTKFNTLSLIGFAIHGLVSFTALPLRLFTLVGLIIAFISLLHAGYILSDWLFNSDTLPPPGWLTLATGVYFLGGLQLVGIGVIGEYLAQNLIETRKRPSFIVVESNTDIQYK